MLRAPLTDRVRKGLLLFAWSLAMTLTVTAYLAETTAAQSQNVVAVLLSSGGTVEFRSAAFPVWSPVRNGQGFEAGTILSTGPGSEARVRLVGDQVLNITENAQIVLGETTFAENSDTFLVNVLQGNLILSSEPRSETALAARRNPEQTTIDAATSLGSLTGEQAEASRLLASFNPRYVVVGTSDSRTTLDTSKQTLLALVKERLRGVQITALEGAADQDGKTDEETTGTNADGSSRSVDASRSGRNWPQLADLRAVGAPDKTLFSFERDPKAIQVTVAYSWNTEPAREDEFGTSQGRVSPFRALLSGATASAGAILPPYLFSRQDSQPTISYTHKLTETESEEYRNKGYVELAISVAAASGSAQQQKITGSSASADWPRAHRIAIVNMPRRVQSPLSLEITSPNFENTAEQTFLRDKSTQQNASWRFTSWQPLALQGLQNLIAGSGPTLVSTQLGSGSTRPGWHFYRQTQLVLSVEPPPGVAPGGVRSIDSAAALASRVQDAFQTDLFHNGRPQDLVLTAALTEPQWTTVLSFPEVHLVCSGRLRTLRSSVLRQYPDTRRLATASCEQTFLTRNPPSVVVSRGAQ